MGHMDAGDGMGDVAMIAAENWAEFLGTSKAKPWGPRRGEGEVTIKPKTEIEVSRQYTEELLAQGCSRPFWAYSLGYEDGPRTCWLCHKLIPEGRTGIWVSRPERQVHTRCLTPSQWHTILGQPYGGDSRIMSELRARQTREGKKSV